MQALNKKYRHQDKSTDVLSFPQYNWKRALKVKSTPTSAVKILNPLPLGDVIICADEAENNAQETGHTLDKEVCFLLVHGILHLVGHDHMKTSEKKRMFTEQRKLMRFFSGGKSKEPAWKYCITSNKPPQTAKKTKTKANSPKATKLKFRTAQK
jgi:probable rRNA maturation factor